LTVLLLLWALAIGLQSYRSDQSNKTWAVMFSVIGVAVIGYWIYGLLFFDKVMDYERGEISWEELFDAQPREVAIMGRFLPDGSYTDELPQCRE
jgi:hypothetical protein